MDINEKYFGYGSTMSFILFNRIENTLNVIIDNKLSSTYLKSVTLSKSLSNLDLICLYYSKTNYIIIFDILKNCTKSIIDIDSEIVYQDYNTNNYLLILFDNGTLGLIKSNSQQKVELLQNIQKIVLFKWYPFCSLDENIFAACNSDNELYTININSNKKYEAKIELNNAIKEYKNNKIVEAQWYLSDINYKYILIGFDSSDIVLCDMNPLNISIITRFERTGKSLSKLIWIKNEPGAFLVFYKNSAKISAFNVSSPNVKHTTKITNKSISNSLLITYGNENKLLLALTDGEVYIYDLDNKKIEKQLTKGHSGSIFDLKFSPHLKGIMATGSIDGSIKIWDIYNDEKNIINLISSDSGVNYDQDKAQIISIKWSPIQEDKNLLLCGDSKNWIKIWNIETKKIICKLELGIINNNNDIYTTPTPLGSHTYTPTPKKVLNNYNVMGLDWNNDNNIIATCNTSIYIINFMNNKLILTDVINIHHRLNKIEFSPYPEEQKTKTFSVACSDGKIRIYEISKLNKGNNISPSKILSGHKNSVFGINYKPFNNSKKYFLASGSDDYRIGIWDLTDNQNQKVKFLYGHTDKVRNVVWFKEENILISGSWDGLAFIWDINNYICLSIINNHKSDVYGIDTNNINPYLFATSSRDCSIYIFNYDINPIKHILLYKEKDNINNENNILFNKLKNIDSNDKITKAELISEYYLGYPCLKEFYDILRIIKHKNEHNTDNNKILHITDLYSAYKSKILKSEFDFNNNDNNNEDNNKKSLIYDAIKKCSAINDWEKFCELNILINNWKKALMFAPKVSKKYWEDLVIRYNQHLEEKEEQKNNDDSFERLKFKLLESSITKDIKGSLELLRKEKEYDDYLLLFVRNIINKNIKSNDKINNINNFFEGMNEEDKINHLINKIKDKNGENYLELMKIINLSVKDKLNDLKLIEAVCLLLSVNQITLSIKLLISLSQYELAFYLMDIAHDYSYEDIIYISLLKHSIKMNNYKNHISLISICENKKIKLRLYKLLLNNDIKLEAKDQKDFEDLLKSEQNNELNLFLNLHNKFQDFLSEIIIKYYNILLTELVEEKLKLETLLEINELFNELRIYNFNVELKNNKKENIKKKILLIIIILETFNENCASVKFLINRFLKIANINNINQLDENEKMIIGIGNYFYKSIKNESLFNVNFNLNLSLKNNINFEKIRKNFNNEIQKIQNSNDINILKRFCCDLFNKFYLHYSNIKNEILEANKYIQIINDTTLE